MGTFFSGLFSSKQNTQPAAALRITTSLQGVPVPWLLGGQQRLPGNLIWYGGFYSSNSSASGGKGGLFTSSGNSGYSYYASFMLACCEGPDISSLYATWVNGTQYLQSGGVGTHPDAIFLGTYSQNQWPAGLRFDPSQMLYYRGLCYTAYYDYPLGSSAALPQLNEEFISTNTGLIAGIPDGDASVCWTKFLTDPFRGLGFPTARMGGLTNWQQYCIATGMLVSPALVSAVQASSFAKDLLDATNSDARWSSGLLTVVPYGDTQITAGTHTIVTEEHLVAYGNLLLPYGAYPQVAVTFADQIVSDGGVTYTNSGQSFTKLANNTLPTAPGQYSLGLLEGPGIYWLSGFDIGQQVSVTYTYAEVASYTPNITPIYNLALDQFLPNQGTIGQGLATDGSPLTVVRKPRDQMLNVVKLTYLDRSNSYNPVTIEVKNEASLQAYGRWRANSAKQYDFFCLAAAAQQSAALQLQREQIARTFQWTSGPELILLDVMDLVEVSDTAQNIINQAVRITEIQENVDFTLTFTAEEFLGTATAPLYNIQANSGFAPNFNVAPDSVNIPAVIEPQSSLVGATPQIWIGASGGSGGVYDPNWGGCNVWISTDETNYENIGSINGPSRQGVLVAPLSAAFNGGFSSGFSLGFALGGTNGFSNGFSAGFGQGAQTQQLVVNLAESNGALTSGTALDAQLATTLCIVDQEFLSYQAATLIAPNEYSLSGLQRGLYGTLAVSHLPGAGFCRVDNTLFEYNLPPTLINQQLYLILQSFNLYGGGLQPLDECAIYFYTPTGIAYEHPVANALAVGTTVDLGMITDTIAAVDDLGSGVSLLTNTANAPTAPYIIGNVDLNPQAATVPPLCSGGTETTFGGNTILTFFRSGTLVVSGNGTINYLVVAGGGGGTQGGGGGAGGLLSGSINVSAGSYLVSVGAGGAGDTNANGSNGSSSAIGFATPISALGGGGGAYASAGMIGGSGGGGYVGAAGSGTAGQGNSGGAWGGPNKGAGGGGGAGAAGSAGAANGGTGGNGLASTITGYFTYYAGGGGGYGNLGSDGVNGAGNAGGGGGGGGLGGNAGNRGIVIISFASAQA